jgi:hypothetical protein
VIFVRGPDARYRQFNNSMPKALSGVPAVAEAELIERLAGWAEDDPARVLRLAFEAEAGLERAARLRSDRH